MELPIHRKIWSQNGPESRNPSDLNKGLLLVACGIWKWQICRRRTCTTLTNFPSELQKGFYRVWDHNEVLVSRYAFHNWYSNQWSLWLKDARNCGIVIDFLSQANYSKLDYLLFFFTKVSDRSFNWPFIPGVSLLLPGSPFHKDKKTSGRQ